MKTAKILCAPNVSDDAYRHLLDKLTARFGEVSCVRETDASLVGGFIGICLGEGIALIAAKLMGTKFVFSVSAIMLGFGFSAAVGIVFGWMPAKRASELNPIDALRAE